MPTKSLTHTLAVTGFIVTFGLALVTARKAQPQTTRAVNGDQEFAMKAASGGMTEVKLGQLAMERGTNPAVKAFGQRMVTDHSKANDELKALVMHDNISLPSNPSSSDQAAYDRLSKLSGKQFDDAYATAMVKDHEEDIAEFQRESTSGTNDRLKSFAAKTLPTLESHLQQAKEMEKSVRAEK